MNLHEKKVAYPSICCLLFAVLVLNIFLLLYLKIIKKVAIFSELVESFCLSFVKILRKVEFVGKFLIFSQILFMGLKAEGTITWSWKEVFWIYWISFSLMIPISVGFFLLFLGKFYQHFIDNITTLEGIL